MDGRIAAGGKLGSDDGGCAEWNCVHSLWQRDRSELWRQPPGKDLYACSVVALDASTGKMSGTFQATHHDIYDWDMNAPPTLIDVKKDGKVIPAIAQSTKVGYLYILNRLTGEAVFAWKSAGSAERRTG